MRHYRIILSGWQVDNVSEFTRDRIVTAMKTEAARWDLVDVGESKFVVPAHVIGIEELN
jgi:hypothetical protein